MSGVNPLRRRDFDGACPKSQRKPQASGVVGLLVEILRGSVKLPGAACVSDPQMFDGDDANATEGALARCGTCPCLQECREWASSFAVGRLSGVVAGEVYGAKEGAAS
jgi:hypothetical protein